MRALVPSLFALLLLATPAAAAPVETTGVDVTIRANGYSSVSLVLRASEDGGHVSMPIGTLLTTGDLQQQDLVLADAVDVELEPGRQRTLSVRTYCVHPHRSPPRHRAAMNVRGMADSTLAALAGEAGTQSSVQEAIWAHLDQRTTHDDEARRILARHGLVVKEARASSQRHHILPF